MDKVFTTGDVETYALSNVHLGVDRGDYPEIKKRTREALDHMGMSHLKHYPSQLFGGPLRRVAVARALAGEPTGDAR